VTRRAARPILDGLTRDWLEGFASKHTSDAYEGDLAAFVAWCEAEGRSPLDADPGVERYRDACGGAQASTVARRLAALSSFYDHAVDKRAVPVNPVDAVDRPARAPASTGSPLAEREALALFSAAMELGPKVAALVALLLFDGMKLGEALALEVGSLDGSAWAMRATLTRRGRPQMVPLDGRSAQALAAYLAGRTSGPLFVGDSPTRRAGASPRLTRFGADFLLKQAAAAAGIERKVSANTLRHSYIALAHRGGTPVSEIQRHIGHAQRRDTNRFLT
jgi:integrase/recombinase XerD